jgi:threonine/homoserine/homoserine lactone efflux protein
MTIELVLPLVVIFVLGAISPGPSLAIVLRNSAHGGRRHGVLTGLGHGLGFGVYAFLAALGFAAAIAASDTAIQVLRWLGIVLLIYLGYVYAKSAISRSQPNSESNGRSSDRSGLVEGALVAIFNPKILAWMLAIYAPFIDSELRVLELLGIAAIGLVIDGTWYMSVATFLTSGNRSQKLRSNASKIDGVMATLMFVFVGVLIVDLF